MIKTNLFSKGRPLAEYLKKQKDNQKFLKTVETSGSFALITFFLFFAIRPTALTISSLIGEIKAKEKMVSEMRKKISDVVMAQDSFSRVQERYSVINSALPDSPRYSQSMVQIISTLKEAGMNPDDINYNLRSTDDDNINNSRLGSYSVSMSQSTSFLPALDLIEKILNNRRLISLNTVRITSNREIKKPKSNSVPENQIDVSFTNHIYYWKESNEKK